jgi:iron complex outermembrane recepter protein
MSRNSVSTLVHQITRVLYLSGALATLTHAQTTEDTSPVSANDEVNEVVVTGSRILRTEAESPSPVTVLSRETFEQVGDIDVIREINKLPQVVGGRGPTENNGFAGSFIDLRGLDRKRTLTLVNGRRYISTLSDGGSDVSSIPPELIERVDILTGGASATYGSDAVAGVVNFILRTDFEGLELSAQQGRTSRGEDNAARYALTAGGRFANDRGQAFINLSFTDTEQIFAGNRRYANQLLINDAGQLISDRSSYTSSTVATVGDVFGIFQNGELFSAPGILNELSDAQRFEEFSVNGLQQGLEQKAAFAGVNFSLTDNISLYSEATFVTEDIVSSGTPTVVDIDTPINIDNPFIGDLTRNYLLAQGLVVDDQFTLPDLRRRFTEFGRLDSETPRDSYRIVLGATAKLADWTLDGYGLSQRSRFTLRDLNAVDLLALRQSLQAVEDGDGNIVCADSSFNCTPVNIFGTNSLSAEQLEFLRVDPSVEGENRDTVVGASVAGTLMQLPAGDLGVAFGAEYLSFYAAELPDRLFTSGQTSSGGFARLAGRNESNQLFGEFNLPLLSEKRFAEYLAFEGGLRWSDFKQSQAEWTYKALLNWTPISGVKFRGGFQRAVREPNVFEKFGGDSSLSSLELDDPCLSGNPLTGELRASCIASGLAETLADTGATASGDTVYRSSQQASPDLTSETANSWTVGVVLEDLGVDRLLVTLDYYDIKIEDSIEFIGEDLIFRQCFDFASSETRDLCGQITRDPLNGEVTQVLEPRANVGELRNTGIDLGVAYGLDLPSLFSAGNGTLRMNFNGNYRFENSLLPNRAVPESEFDCAGYYGDQCLLIPSLQIISGLTWDDGPVTLGLSWQYFGKADDILTKEDPEFAAELLARQSVPSVSYFDLSASWDISENTEIFGGIDNLLDKEPPVVGDDRAFLQTQYDYIGQRYYLGLRVAL